MSNGASEDVRLPIVDDEGNTILVSANEDTDIVDGLAEGDDLIALNDESERQTITLNLDEATQFFLQQQGIGSNPQAIELEDGSFQFFNHTLIQIQREDGTLETQALPVEMLQALHGELVQQLQPSLDADSLSLLKSDLNEDNETGVDDDDTVAESIQDRFLESTDISQQAHSDIPDIKSEIVSSPVKRSQEITTLIGNAETNLLDEHGAIRNADESKNLNSNEQDNVLSNICLTTKDTVLQNIKKENDQYEGEEQEQRRKAEFGRGVGVSCVKKGAANVKEPDLANPIPLSKQTVITVKGKKCVLQYDEKTQQVCAYPIKSAKGRGRPRMSEAEKVAARQKKLQRQMELLADAESSTDGTPSEKSSAAETLLELSNTGPGSIRRSSRARKKAKLLEDFEELEDSDDEDAPFEDNQIKDPDIHLDIVPDAKRRKMITVRRGNPPINGTSTSSTPNLGGKRGRGRPRRYPAPGQQNPPTSIPALMLPSADGQTLVMAPIQDFQNFQHLRRQLPNLVPKPSSNPNVAGQISSLPTVSLSQSGDGVDTHNIILSCSQTDTLPLDASSVLDSNSMMSQALQGDNMALVGDTADSIDHGAELDTSPSSLLNMIASASSEADKGKNAGHSSDTSESQGQQHTVIQIPDNLLSTFGFKKDPIKIGLKASERELEKLKCPKCDFQGFYVQQYRNHIATHGDDIQKCKCCSFISLDLEELLEHFKEYHPRCFCAECGYMAEHAYIIKRHMMRHDVKSCTCHICGKVYKDMYILKMHIKMVHMPAEVLFECDVCSKKFTRRAHLKRHMRIHEPEKPFKCSMCDYRGCERSDISKHMLIHQEPKHACERCGKTFRHIKNKELHVKRHYGQRDYKCGVCDFYGYTFTDIRKHIERKHQDIKTVVCDKCGRHFRNEISLKEHYPNCQMMMIEQVLGIPTTTGGSNQTTIQIPSQHLAGHATHHHHLGPLEGMLTLDPSTAASVVQAQGVAGMVVATQQTETGDIIGAAAPQNVSIMVASADGRLVEASAMDHEVIGEEEDIQDEDIPGEVVKIESHQSMNGLIDSDMIEDGRGGDGQVNGQQHHLLTTSSNSNEVVTSEHGQVIEHDGQHYISTLSGLHLITTAASISTADGESGSHSVMGGQFKHDDESDSLSLRHGADPGLSSHEGVEETPQAEGDSHLQHHFIAIESLDGDNGADREVKTEILVSMEDWNAACPDDSLMSSAVVTSESDKDNLTST